METKMDTPENVYRTADLYFAAFLKVAAVPFHDTTRVVEGGRSKVVFEFHPHDMSTMRTLKQEYFSGKAKVSAHDHTQAIKMMKQLTHMG